MNYTMTSEDVEKIEKLIEIRNHGFYADGKEVTDLYNKVLNKHLAPTNCGSCIRQRVGELEQALNHFKSKIASERDETSSSIESKDSKSVSEPQVDNTPQEENNAAVDAGKDAIRERMAKVRAARKNKKKDEEK